MVLRIETLPIYSTSAHILLVTYEGSMEYGGLILFLDTLKEVMAPGP